jgi:choline-glycine betaine transporter
MSKRPFIMGVYCGILALAAFLLIHLIQWKPPNLTQAIMLVLACAAFVSAFDCGRLLIRASTSLGDLENHRLTMMLGAFAVIWVSLESLFKVFYALLIQKSP